jgi:hypothetical protein
MKRLLIVAAAVAVLAGGTAFSQSFSAQYDTTQYAGAALGLPITGYFGVNDLLWQGTDVRFRAGIWPLGALAVTVGADVLAELTAFDDAGRFVLYGGGGPSVGFASYLGAGGLYADVIALLGVSFRFAEEYSVFVEAGGGFGYGRIGSGGVSVGGFLPAYRGAVGFLFHY